MRTARVAIALPVVALLAMVRCRTAHPGDATPVPPVIASSTSSAWQQLLARRRDFAGVQSYMRLRVTAGGRTLSFKTLLAIDRAGHTRLTAFSPIGTAAFSLYDDGSRILVVNHVARTWWSGSADELARLDAVPLTSVRPSDLGFLLIGLPPTLPQAELVPPPQMPDDSNDRLLVPGPQMELHSDGRITYAVTPNGLAAAAAVEEIGDVVRVDFDPPAYPPTRVAIRRTRNGAALEQIAAEHLDLVSTASAVAAPEVPGGYAPMRQ
jgi:hypothetical protein